MSPKIRTVADADEDFCRFSAHIQKPEHQERSDEAASLPTGEARGAIRNAAEPRNLIAVLQQRKMPYFQAVLHKVYEPRQRHESEESYRGKRDNRELKKDQQFPR